MSGRNGGASAIAALALAVHRAPARHPELLHANDPLPPGVGILLRLAGGTSYRNSIPRWLRSRPRASCARPRCSSSSR